MFFGRPTAQINELAALRAKRPVWIFRRPFHSLITGGTINDARCSHFLSVLHAVHLPDDKGAVDFDRCKGRARL